MRLSGFSRPILFAALCGGALQAAQAAETARVLVTFKGPNGSGPQGALVADAAGNLYGTAQAGGGAANDGTVFKLTKPATPTGIWKQTTLLTFTGANGAQPVASLVIDAKGNLYGTALRSDADGLVFELSPPAAGKKAWTETVLASFTGTNGNSPQGGLIADAAGNLYGATIAGGSANAGLVFRLSPPASAGAAWTQTVLASLDGAAGGAYPTCNLAFDAQGNLYGTTTAGGASGDGTVFMLTPGAGGAAPWTEQVLFSFDGATGQTPYAGVLIDSAGNLYGTTAKGGADGDGLVYRLNKPAVAGDAWTETVLTTFKGANGNYAFAALTADASFNLYGVTGGGGKFSGGALFKLVKPASGKGAWPEKLLFSLQGKFGYGPSAAVYIDAAGDVFGSTAAGTTLGDGTIFEVTP
jgi:uncharacterized repeat protein (TIGR03803 family)